MRLVLILISLAVVSTAQAQPDSLEFGRYLSKYPGMYSTATYRDNPRDEIFDEHGRRTNSVTPTYGAGNAFPEQRGTVNLEWHFPWFETEALPFISSRLWSARATLGYAKLATEGPINTFITANGQVDKSEGITDIELEFGPTLLGSGDWRTRKTTPLSLFLLGHMTLPTGARDPDSPNNVGGNVFAFGGTLGAHAQGLGFVLDAGASYRTYQRNEEPAFGGQEPSRRGEDLALDATLARKIFGPVYLSASLYARQGEANEYSRVRFANNAPSASLGMESFPDPGTFTDGGTRELSLGLGAHWFVIPRLRLSVNYWLPQSGKSGAFDLPFREQPMGCVALPGGCNPTPNGSARVDGLGSARSYASNFWMLSFTYSHKQGDFWL